MIPALILNRFRWRCAISNRVVVLRFPISRLSLFFWGGEFPDWSSSLFLGLLKHLQGTQKGPQHNQDFPSQKRGKPPGFVGPPPYCAIPRDYLGDTPLLRDMGFSVSQLCAIPPPPYLGCLSDTCAIPYENKAKACDAPPLRYYLERALREIYIYIYIYGGGVSRAGLLSPPASSWKPPG